MELVVWVVVIMVFLLVWILFYVGGDFVVGGVVYC